MSARLLATALAGLTACLLVRPIGRPARRLQQPGAGLRAGDRDGVRGRRRVPAALLAACAAAVGIAVAGILGVGGLAGAGTLVTATAALLLAGTAVRLRSRRRSDRAAAARRASVIEALAVLSADLRAGRPPQDALTAASEVCAELGPAAEIAKLGGDVGAALVEASAVPGAGGLAALGAAWRVVERSGVALSSVAARLSESLRADEAARRQSTAALAGARSTARLLAGLPLLGTLLGQLLGAEPLAFLTGTPPGWFCLLSGIALMITGLAWVERLIAEPGAVSHSRDRAVPRHRPTRGQTFGAAG